MAPVSEELTGCKIVEHRGRCIIRLDFTKTSPDEVRELLDVALQNIVQSEAGSVRLLVLPHPTTRAAAVQAIRSFAMRASEFVRGVAFVGGAAFQNALFWLIAIGVPHETFDDEQSAREWLAQLDSMRRGFPESHAMTLKPTSS